MWWSLCNLYCQTPVSARNRRGALWWSQLEMLLEEKSWERKAKMEAMGLVRYVQEGRAVGKGRCLQRRGLPSRAPWAVPDHGACSASGTAGREVLAISCLGWQRVFLTQQELHPNACQGGKQIFCLALIPVPGCGGCLCFKSGGPGLWLRCWVTTQLVGLFGQVASYWDFLPHQYSRCGSFVA